MARGKGHLGRTKAIARYGSSTDCRRRSYCRKVLCQKAGISSSGPDVHEANVPRSYDRKTEGGSKNLAAAFAVRAVEREDIHLYLPYGIGAFTRHEDLNHGKLHSQGICLSAARLLPFAGCDPAASSFPRRHRKA